MKQILRMIKSADGNEAQDQTSRSGIIPHDQAARLIQSDHAFDMFADYADAGIEHVFLIVDCAI